MNVMAVLVLYQENGDTEVFNACSGGPNVVEELHRRC